MENKKEITTLAGGCFWCTEAIFKRLKGVISVAPGYSGGTVENPSYEEVSSGNTGHVETIQIEFDPAIISFEKILDVFFHTHDPTSIDRQGADVGPQYKSVIFYYSEKQKETAEKLKEKMEKSGEFQKPIVTEILAFKNFYPAENYHKNYYETHKDALYCRLVISPKLHKLMKSYQDDLKEEYK